VAASRRSGFSVVACAVILAVTAAPEATVLARSPRAAPPAAAAAVGAPNIFFYNLDDLRDVFPGGIDPLQYMPKTRQWMAAGLRFTNTNVTTPSCCPSRSALMTGRYAHNNGVRLQSQGPNFDLNHSMGCYLKNNGYATYVDGKFLTTWPKTTRPPCFDHSTVMWGGYSNVATRVDGVAKQSAGYSTTMLGTRGREYITQALTLNKPFLLYETPQAPHWVDTSVNGVATRVAIPDAKYKNAAVGTCSGVPEADRSDKPAYVRRTNFSAARGQEMCASQMRAIMTADDEFGATMQLLSDRGVLDNTLVIFSSDNGYNWGEHGRTEKFVPYEPTLHVPLWIRWPSRFAPGTNRTRVVSYLDLLPTMLEAAGITLPAGSPSLDGESLLKPSTRTTMYSEYFADVANGVNNGVATIDTWRMVRKGNVKYIQTYDASGAVTFREYYNLANDPAENTNLLGDATAANDPPAAEVATLTALVNQMSTCAGAACVK
jgi:N-acetylglucosamine-6-sulfatase